MSPFDKRVQLLEKWHTENPLINTDNLAELVLEVWQVAEADTEQRIIKLLEEERWKLPDGSPLGGEVYLPIEQAIALIKGE